MLEDTIREHTLYIYITELSNTVLKYYTSATVCSLLKRLFNYSIFEKKKFLTGAGILGFCGGEFLTGAGILGFYGG